MFLQMAGFDGDTLAKTFTYYFVILIRCLLYRDVR